MKKVIHFNSFPPCIFSFLTFANMRFSIPMFIINRPWLYCLYVSFGNCFWYCLSTFITCIWRELSILLFSAYYWCFYIKAFFFSIELFWSPPGMNGESIKSSDNWLYVWYTKKRHCDLPDPASITAGLSALLLVVDDCARISISPGYSATVMAHDKDETSARPCLNADRTWALSKLQRLNLSTPWLIRMPPAFQKT